MVERAQYYKTVTNLNAFVHLDLKEQLATRTFKSVTTAHANMEGHVLTRMALISKFFSNDLIWFMLSNTWEYIQNNVKIAILN